MFSQIFFSVSSGNFMVDVKNQSSSYRLLALFPYYNRTAASTLSDSDVSYRRKEITHEGIRAVLEKWREVFAEPFDFLCADSKYRRLIPTLHFLNLDGQEIAMHTMCSILNCPVCNVPRSELGNPDFEWELRDSREVQIKYFILKLIKLCVNVYRLFEINVQIYERI